MAEKVLADACCLRKIEANTSGFGCKMRLGDLSGDGRLDVVLIQPDVVSDERFFAHSVFAATAYTPDGEILWQIGTPSYDENATNGDVPAQIFDIDRDGANEFLCIMDGEFLVLDGKYGDVKRRSPLPDAHATDTFIIADLEGKGYPQNIILKNRYHQLWAMDFNFNVIWTYKGNIGNLPIACDINKDGRDEIIAGKVCLSADGEVLWEFEGSDYPKSITVADFSMSGEEEILTAGEKYALYDKDGQIKWQVETNAKIHSISVGNFRPDTFGYEILGFFDEDDTKCGIFLSDYHLNTLFKEKRTDEVKREKILSVFNFDGEGKEHIILSDENATYLYDGYMTPVYVINAKGLIMTADIFGDNKEEVVIYDGESILIYGDEKKEVLSSNLQGQRPQVRSLYNYSEYPYLAQDKKRNALGYAIGQFASPKIKEWAIEVATEETLEEMTRGDFTILLTKALGIEGYSPEVFFDCGKNDYFYSAVSTLKAYGYIDDIVGKFSPYAPTSAGFAIDLIEKATKISPLCLKSGEEILTRQEIAKLILQIYQNV